MTDGARPGWTPPLGTNQRIRNRAIWAVGLRNPYTFTFQPGGTR